MITKEQFLNSFVHELEIIKHLGEKVTPEMLDYKPTETQRTMGELLDYMGKVYHVGLDAFISGSEKAFGELWMKLEPVTLENFKETMDMQIKKVSEKINMLTDDELAAISTIYGMTFPLSVHILSLHKWATAYKMQLFLYLKSNGVSEIGTMNLWAGMDAPKNE